MEEKKNSTTTTYAFDDRVAFKKEDYVQDDGCLYTFFSLAMYQYINIIKNQNTAID